MRGVARINILGRLRTEAGGREAPDDHNRAVHFIVDCGRLWDPPELSSDVVVEIFVILS